MEIDIPRFETFARKVTRMLHHDGKLGWNQNHCKSKKSQITGFSYDNSITLFMISSFLPLSMYYDF